MNKRKLFEKEYKRLREKAKDPKDWYKYHMLSVLVPEDIASDHNIFM